MNCAVRLSNVSLHYRSKLAVTEALSNVSLSIPQQSSTAIVGRSGSGKSSLMSVIGLMRRPTGGKVYYGELDTSRSTPSMRAKLRNSSVSFVFQSFHLAPHLTVAENVMLKNYISISPLSWRDARERSSDLIDLVGLSGLESRRIHQLSGGERQRVAIARGLFEVPVVLIADEPTGNLDESNSAEVMALLYSLPTLVNCSLLVVTHDRLVAGGADRAIELTHGRISSIVESASDENCEA